MTYEIKAIETNYAGYRFRSRLEARWAVFLDSFKEPWEYEVEGYELPSGRYLPDFWLPRLYCWLEIKGQEPTEKETLRCVELAMATNKPVALAWGLPVACGWTNHKMYMKDAVRLDVFCTAYDTDPLLSVPYPDRWHHRGWWDRCYWAQTKTGKLCIGHNSSDDYTFHNLSLEDFPGMKSKHDILGPIPEHNVNLAKSARFEFKDKLDKQMYELKRPF